MSKLHCRGSIALAAVVVALLWPGPAAAQVGISPGTLPQPGGLVTNLITGVQYDIANQAAAEHHLQYREAKLRRDCERGHKAAADRDVRRIEALRYRIVVDEWLIRENKLLDPGCYPFPFRGHPISNAAIVQASVSPRFP